MRGDVDSSPAGRGPAWDVKRVRVRGLISMFVWGVLLVLFLRFLNVFTVVIMGLLAAVCVTMLLRPLLLRTPGPRALKGFVIGLLPLAFCGSLLYISISLLVPPIHRVLASLPNIEARLNQWLASANSNLWLHPGNPLTVRQVVEAAWGWFNRSGFFAGVGATLIDLAIGVVFFFIGTIYMLAEPAERAVPAVVDLLPQPRRAPARATLTALEPRLRSWLIGAIVTATIIGLTSLLGFWIISLPFMIPLAILAGLSEFIPTFGPAMAFLLALLVAGTVGAGEVLWLLGLYVVVHILESYILIPIVYKEAVRIPPVITLFTMVLWGGIFGLGGLILAIPINLVLWTAAEHFIAGHKLSDVHEGTKEPAPAPP